MKHVGRAIAVLIAIMIASMPLTACTANEPPAEKGSTVSSFGLTTRTNGKTPTVKLSAYAKSITTSTGKLSPKFAEGKTAYTVRLAAKQISAKLTLKRASDKVVKVKKNNQTVKIKTQVSVRTKVGAGKWSKASRKAAVSIKAAPAQGASVKVKFEVKVKKTVKTIGKTKTKTSTKTKVYTVTVRRASAPDNSDMGKMKITVNGKSFTATMENNASAKALMELLAKEPLTIQMNEYGGFEQVGSLGQQLPSNDVQTTTSAGDIVLYSSSNIVIFYGSNSWSYTRLGKIEGASAKEIKNAFGSGASVTFSIN